MYQMQTDLYDFSEDQESTDTLSGVMPVMLTPRVPSRLSRCSSFMDWVGVGPRE